LAETEESAEINYENTAQKNESDLI